MRWFAVKKLAIVALEAILIFSLFKIFSVDNTLIEFVVLGKVPGLELYLGLFTTSLFGIFGVYLLSVTIQYVIHDFIDFRYELMQKEIVDNDNAVLLSNTINSTHEDDEKVLDELEVLAVDGAAE